MKLFFLYILLGCIVLGLGFPLRARAQEDYEFYKKYGNSNKAWNQEVEAGFAAYDKQDCEGTVTHLQEAIRLQAQDALIYYKMAVCTELKGSPYTALQYYQLAQEKLQTLPAVHRYQQEIYENYGRALLKADKKKEALPYLSRAAAVGTPSFALFYMVGSLSAENGDSGAALDYYKKAIGQDTSDVDPQILGKLYFLVGKSFYDNKDYTQASTYLDKAVQLDPSNTQAQQMRNDINLAREQQSMTQMLNGLSQKGTTGGTTPGAPAPATGSSTTGPAPVTANPGSMTPETTAGASNLPPAAAKLPPLNPPAPAPTSGSTPQAGPAPPGPQPAPPQ